MDSTTGDVLYSIPLTGITIQIVLLTYFYCVICIVYVGARFDLWCGCYSSKSGVALLACVAINGFHSSAKYMWEYNGLRVSSHDTPLLYCNQLGKYLCYVTCCDRCTSRGFELKGI